MSIKTRKDMIGVLVIRIPLHSHSINVLRAQTVFIQEKYDQCVRDEFENEISKTFGLKRG